MICYRKTEQENIWEKFELNPETKIKTVLKKLRLVASWNPEVVQGSKAEQINEAIQKWISNFNFYFDETTTIFRPEDFTPIKYGFIYLD